MVAKRIIPCLDIKGGRAVKGINFLNLRDAGDPVECARRYCTEGADELVLLDISATEEERGTTVSIVRQVAHVLDIPFTVGGGVRTLADVSALLSAGADKVSVNSAAVMKPHLIDELAREFGSQCIVVAIDTRRIENQYEVFIGGGKSATGINTLQWARQVSDRGAGEILLTSMNQDGTQEGFELEITRMVSDAVCIPVIASGGAGTQDHFVQVFETGAADAALAASVFHDKMIEIGGLKDYLSKNGVEVRR
jgi:cyclase